MVTLNGSSPSGKNPKPQQETIMCIIYEPRGKAKEYSKLAANLYKGCSHGCTYCYAPAATFTKPEQFVRNISPRKNVLAHLAKDCEQYRGDTRQILLSFTSDAYQPIEEKLQMTRAALQLMLAAELRVTVLTKGGMLASRDFDLLASSPHSEFAATLTTDDPRESLLWEPGAALPEDRILSLRIAHAKGIRTWVSFEPVFNPAAVYRLIDATAPFVDFYKVGKMNYHKSAAAINWPEFRTAVVNKLESIGKPYLIKKDLAAAK